MLLSSPKNPWIRQLRQLHQAKGRREQGAFLLEGTHLLQEALLTGWPLLAVCYQTEWALRSQEVLQRIPVEVPQHSVSPEVLAALATTEHPDGVVAVARRQELPPPKAMQLGIALEKVQDPGNVGALIRLAAAAAADAFWLSADSVDSDHPKVLRASAGQWFRLPPQPIVSLPQSIASWRAQGLQVLATAASSRSYWHEDLTQPTVFLLGNEGSGLSPETVALADKTIGIPMAVGVESLNVAMVGGLLLYEARRQRFTNLQTIRSPDPPSSPVGAEAGR